MRKLIALSAATLIAGCIPSAPRPPAPAPRPAPRPSPVPVPPPAQPTGDWRDWPITPGTWTYRQDARGSIALFGVAGQDADVTLRCDRQARAIYLSRKGAASTASSPMTIITSSQKRTLASKPTGGSPAYMAVALTPGDTLLDAMGYSRGRFILEQTGLPFLVVPAWPEILRVTEDCRK